MGRICTFGDISTLLGSIIDDYRKSSGSLDLSASSSYKVLGASDGYIISGFSGFVSIYS